jgi:HK97 family phage prohead protease
MNQQIERRTFPASALQRDAAGDGKQLAGYAAVFNQWSEDLGGFGFEMREQIAPGAFADSLKDGDIRALWNHNPDYVLGRTGAGTLTLREDNTGLWIENTPPDAQWARDLMASIQRGDVSQMSFAFSVIEDEFRYDREKDVVYRTLNKVRLYEVSPVTFPAYTGTSVNVRAGSLSDALLQRAEAFRNQHIGQAAGVNDEQPPSEGDKRNAERQAAQAQMRMRVRIAQTEI